MESTKLRTREVTYCAVFTALIALCAWISIPTNVPFTMQTFGIFVTLLSLGGRLGSLSILSYLTLGAMGAPVFSGFTGGLGRIFGTTGGYLLGFLVIGVLYFIMVKKPLEKPLLDVIALVTGLFLSYLLGTLQFVYIYSRNVAEIGMFTAFGVCVLPFVLPDLTKLSLALVIAKRIGAYVKI